MQIDLFLLKTHEIHIIYLFLSIHENKNEHDINN